MQPMRRTVPANQKDTPPSPSTPKNTKVGWFYIRSGIILALVVLVELADTTSSSFLIPYLKRKWSQFHEPFIAQLTVVMLFSGMLIGNIIWAILADKYGRRRVLFPCIICNIFAGVSLSFSNSAVTFILFRTIQGFAAGGLLNVAYILFSELLPPSYKMSGLMQFKASYGVATAAGTLASYLTLCSDTSESWRILVLVNVPLQIIILLLLQKYIPKSPKWLISQNRAEEAVNILSKIQAVNNKGCYRTSPHHTSGILRNLPTEEVEGDDDGDSIIEDEKKEQQYLRGQNKEQKYYRGHSIAASAGVNNVSHHRLCTTTRECRMTLAFLLLRGLLQFTSTWMLFVVPNLQILEGRQYSMQGLIGLCKIGGAILTIWLINGNGRKRSLIFASFLFAISLCLIGVGVVLFPKNISISNATTTNTSTPAANYATTFSTLPSCEHVDSTNDNSLTLFATVSGLTFANVLLAIMYALSQLLVIEYYETSIRSTALGLCMVVQRFCSMLASLLAESSGEVVSMEFSVEIVSIIGISIFLISCYVSPRKPSAGDNFHYDEV
jgi:MFS family permease